MEPHSPLTGSDESEKLFLDVVGKMAEQENLRRWLKKILDTAADIAGQLERKEEEVKDELGPKTFEEILNLVKTATVRPDPSFTVGAFQTILHWIRHDTSNRLIHLDTLMGGLDFAKVDRGNPAILDKEYGILSQSVLCQQMYFQVRRLRPTPSTSTGSLTYLPSKGKGRRGETKRLLVPYLSLSRSGVSLVYAAFSDELKKLTGVVSDKNNVSDETTLTGMPLSRVSLLLRSFHRGFQNMKSIKPPPLPLVPIPADPNSRKKTKKRKSELNLQGPNEKVSNCQEGPNATSMISGEMGKTPIPGASTRTKSNGGDPVGFDQQTDGAQTRDEDLTESAQIRVKMPSGQMTRRKRGFKNTYTSYIIFNALLKKTRRLYSYNTETRKRKSLCEISLLPAFCSSVIAGDRFYVMGGVRASKQATFTDSKQALVKVDIYNLWGKCIKQTGPEMLTKRKEAAAIVRGDFIYMIGGTNANTLTDTCEVLDWTIPGGTAKWEELPGLMEIPKSGHAAAILNDELYAIGGVGVDLFTLESGSVEKYNFATKKWSLVRSLLEPRARAGVGVLNGKIYVVGGVTNRGNQAFDYERLKSVEVYNPTFNLWLPVAPMNVTRREAVVVVRKGKLVVIGGNHGPASTEVYNPAKDHWTFATSKHPYATNELFKKMRGSGFEDAVEGHL